MTLIEISHQFWIETFQYVRRAIPAGAVDTDDFDLTRPGHIVGVSGCKDAAASVADELHLSIRGITNNYLSYGLFIDRLRISLVNNAAISRVGGAHAVIFMRI